MTRQTKCVECGSTVHADADACEFCERFDSVHGNADPTRKAACIDALQAAAAQLGKSPSRREFKAVSDDISPWQVRVAFGTWNAGKRAAGLTAFGPGDAAKPLCTPPDQLTADLNVVAAELGHAPSMSEYRQHGRFSDTPFYRAFGSWPAALEAAGLERDPGRPTDEDILASIRDLAAELGRTPTARQYDAHGEYSRSPIQARFGGWNAAVERAGLEPNSYHNIPTADLLADLERVADALGRAPSMDEYDERGKHASWTLQDRFDTWRAALAAIDYDVRGNEWNGLPAAVRERVGVAADD